jgi:outer membrane immunogenic protein
MRSEKQLLLAATLTMAGPAYAADLSPTVPIKAPIVAGPPSSWTGLYLGIGLGLRASRTDDTTTSATIAVPASPATPINLAGLATSEPLDGTSFRAAPYLGFNWQVAPRWVVGIEGDLGIGNQTTTLGGFEFASPVLALSLAGDGFAVKTTWDASVRGRLGFLVTPGTLVYATGGAAWQHFEETSTCIAQGFCTGVNQFPAITPALISNSVTKTGWTVGGGVETALWGNWFLRGEYRYADFGTASFNETRTGILLGAPLPNTLLAADTFNIALRTHTATVGLAYKLDHAAVANGSGGALGAFPVKAPRVTDPVMSWTGLYAGLGFGLRDAHTEATTTATTNRNLTIVTNGEPLDGTAFRVNPYVGYDWQVAPRWVVGLEGDIGFANQTTTLDGFPLAPADGVAGSSADSFAVKTTWDASARGRLGFLVTPVTLVYATAGAAWQHYDVTSTCAAGFCVAESVIPAVIVDSATKGGWAVGGGLETALWRNWFARADYRYSDFGTSSFNLNRTENFPGFGLLPIAEAFNIALRTHTVTFGVAYKLDATGAPFVVRN